MLRLLKYLIIIVFLFVEVKITDGQGELIAVFTSSGYRKESDLPVDALE